MVSSWAPVQWLRRGRRAYGHNGAAFIVQVALSWPRQFTSFGERGLTLPSRGRPQAGFAHLRPPLMSNVRALQVRSSSVCECPCRGLSGVRKIRREMPVANNATRGILTSEAGLFIAQGWAVLWSTAPFRKVAHGTAWQSHASATQQHRSVVGASRRRAAPGSQLVNRERRVWLNRQSVFPRNRVALCSSSARQNEGKLMHPTEQRPNPSIEGTCNIWLRQLSPAPHVKR